MVITRYVTEKPDTFMVVGLLVVRKEVNPFTGESGVGFDCRIGDVDEPIDISRYLEQFSGSKSRVNDKEEN